MLENTVQNFIQCWYWIHQVGTDVIICLAAEAFVSHWHHRWEFWLLFRALVQIYPNPAVWDHMKKQHESVLEEEFFFFFEEHAVKHKNHTFRLAFTHFEWAGAHYIGIWKWDVCFESQAEDLLILDGVRFDRWRCSILYTHIPCVLHHCLVLKHNEVPDPKKKQGNTAALISTYSHWSRAGD